MRIAVWVSEAPGELRELLFGRSARPRRLVPTENGTFLLGPSPENAKVLLDGLRVATLGAQPATGFAWDGDTAWLVARTERGVTGVRFGPEDRALPKRFADADAGLSERAETDIAYALGRDPLSLRAAVARTSGTGVGRLVAVLRELDLGSEATALAWVHEQGPAPVPVHRRRWVDAWCGELRQARTGLSRPDAEERSGALRDVGRVAMVPVALLLVLPLVPRLDPWWLPVVGVLVGYAAVVVQPRVVLSALRHRRPDPFPVSDPFGLLAAAPDPDGEQRPHLEPGIVDA
ncbi:hypothetical protein [Umezawaea tangerina]|uniref:Uncharacterized protein n=1 Tax=Umezawaea tangerina TaxID=84725 RepID=A0A2T0TLR2_9PSEU|nr:hypothetical protein [Umezawaea tangerina]PRY46650.1 hypothetical protein CLV43_101929 [Umezawaea tangerina]